MKSSPWILKTLVAVLVFALAGTPELIAQSAPPQQPQPPSSVIPDPAKGPLQPAPTGQPQDVPDAPSASRPQTAPAPQTQNVPPPRPEEPLGAAAAAPAKTTGGVASKPAGNAIAPAKQRQVRSLLIKLGAIAAGGAALGIIYGLSRGTPSTPPNAAAATNP